MEVRSKLSQWLDEKCKKERLSLRQAGARTGLSHATIDSIIKGRHPSTGTIKKLAQGFGGNGKRRLALEDRLLILAGYRTPRSQEELSESMAELMDRVSQFDEPRLKAMTHFADFLIEKDRD